jgi:nucleotide-binding universal stress UspA family protein
MSIRKILVPLDGSERDRAALMAAFCVARALGAHVAAMHVRITAADALPFVGEGMSAALVQELVDLTERETTARAAAAHGMFEALLQEAGLPIVPGPPDRDAGAAAASAEWLDVRGQEDDAVVRAGRLADLIVLARPAAAIGVGGQTTFTAALFETGRPVLVASRQGGTMRTDRIVVAWDGSAQASRVLGAALPFLARAGDIVVIMSREQRDDTDELKDVVGYLAWHGIAARHQLVKPAPAAAEALLAAAVGADLLVMGGYSHSRLREMILGGVTRYMLEKATLPLLLAH